MADKITDKEKILFEAIHNEVQHIVDKQMVRMSNHPEMQLFKNIEERAEKQVFKVIDQTIEEGVQNGKTFTDLLKTDAPETYDKLTELYSPFLEEVNGCKTFHDLVAMNKVKIPEEMLQQIYSIAVNYFLSNNFQNALVYFSYLSNLIADRDQIWLLRGMCEQNLRMPEKACSSFETCISLNPEILIAYLHIIECYILADKPTEAKILYDTFLKEADPALLAKDEPVSERMQKIEVFFNDRDNNEGG